MHRKPAIGCGDGDEDGDGDGDGFYLFIASGMDVGVCSASHKLIALCSRFNSAVSSRV